MTPERGWQETTGVTQQGQAWWVAAQAHVAQEGLLSRKTQSSVLRPAVCPHTGLV